MCICWCRCLTTCREDLRYNIEAVDLLISNQFVLMQQYDVHLAHSMENGMNYPAVVFAMQLIQRFCTDIDRLTVRAQEVRFTSMLNCIMEHVLCECWVTSRNTGQFSTECKSNRVSRTAHITLADSISNVKHACSSEVVLTSSVMREA